MNRTEALTSNYNEYVDISLLAIVRAIRTYWYLPVISMAVATTIAVTYAFTATPIYQATTLITPVSGGAGAGGNLTRLLSNFGAGNFAGGFGTSAGRNSRAVSLAALSSPFFTRAFIEEQGLLPELFSERWDADKQQWASDSTAAIPTLSDAYDLFTNEILTVIDDASGDGLVTVSIRWSDPELAANWANRLVASVNERLRERAISDADLTTQYLNEELAKTNAVELQQALYLLIEGEIQKKTVAKVQLDYAFAVLSPAIAPDINKYVSPNRPFIIAAGLLAGLLIGLLLVFMTNTVQFLRTSLDNPAS